MVFCCDPFEPLSPEEEAAAAAAAATATNNASAASPSCGEDPELVKTDSTAKKVDDPPLENEPVSDAEILVSVTLPPGVSPGQKIEVRSPDGRRTVDTFVPDGLEIGQTFLVRFPPTSHSEPVPTLPSTPAEDHTPTEARNDESLPSENEVKESDKKKSLSETIESLLVPTPDPPVNKEKKKPTKVPKDPTPRSNSPSPRSPPNSPPSPEVSPEVKTPVTKQHVLPSTPLKRVEGSPVEATVTPVETRQEGDDTCLQTSDESESETEQEETDTENEEILANDSDINARKARHRARKLSKEKKSDKQGGLNLVRSLEDFLTPKPDLIPSSSDGVRSEAAHLQKRQFNHNEKLQQKIMQRHHHHHNKYMRSQQQHREPYQYPSQPMPPSRVQQPGQKLVQVQVPPGMSPGSTIFVEIPGENRTVAAQVPPNVTTFHVAYTPQGAPRPTPPQARAVVLPPRKSGREKLLSVKVPPGTPPGTTLHVSVPDEPGRILAAKVPPGNVMKFHVSYVPTVYNTPTNRSMLPPANAYRSSAPYHEQHSVPITESRDHREYFGDSYSSPMGTGGYRNTYPRDSDNYSPYITGDNLGATAATEGWGDYGY